MSLKHPEQSRTGRIGVGVRGRIRGGVGVERRDLHLRHQRKQWLLN